MVCWLSLDFLSSPSFDAFGDAKNYVDCHEDYLSDETEHAVRDNVVHKNLVPFILLWDAPILFLRENTEGHKTS